VSGKATRELLAVAGVLHLMKMKILTLMTLMRSGWSEADQAQELYFLSFFFPIC
jgi:hypothetical protein